MNIQYRITYSLLIVGYGFFFYRINPSEERVMPFEMCSECLKNYGAYIEETHKPVSAQHECCGDPEDCSDFQEGRCTVVED